MDTNKIANDIERIIKSLEVQRDDFQINYIDIPGEDSEQFQRNTDIIKKINKLISKYRDILKETIGILQLKAEQEKKTIKETQKRENILDESVPHYLNEDYKGTKPAGIKFINKEKALNNWTDVFVFVCNELLRIDREKFKSLRKDKSFNGRSRIYISRRENEVVKPKKIKYNYYIDGNLSANYIVSLIRKLLKIYSISEKEIKIYLRKKFE